MNPTTTLHSHAHFTRDRFDECRDDRMLVGSVLRYCRNLFEAADAALLEKRAESAVREIKEAITAMDRVALVCIKAETAACTAGEFDRPKRRTLLDGGHQGEDVADPCEWPAWTDRETWTCTDPTPLEVLEAYQLPPIRGGAPEPFEPSADDLAELSRWSAEFAAHLDAINGGVEFDPSHFTEDDARAAGLAI